ncbi:hypothetical protein QYM36_006219 [Artemia franciscana]|uniref:Uncharacterized protein n=1 Tax=Artemia franciscana TaxID=6661 RepID=A0AA88L5A4_ARTSF|nr:hypothetical protein QYM36_006219 [Artemia franciscana]
MACKQDEHKKVLGVLVVWRKELKFSKEKYKFSVNNVCYFGHIIGAGAMKLDPEKIEAINQMPSPQNQEELFTLLGMLNYLGKYIPNLSPQNNILCEIAKQEILKWGQENDKVFSELISSNVSSTSFFDYTSKKIELKADALGHGLEAHLCCSDKIAACES